MPPPDLAAFTFVLDAEGADPALARRALAAAAAHGASRIAVVGAQRWGLLAELARTDAEIVAFDPSRAALGAARTGLENAGVGERVTLFAGDPRDAEIPDGADAVLVPSAAWRLLLFPEAHRSALRSLRRALRGPALLLLDLDRAPPLPNARFETFREGPGRQRWSGRSDGPTIHVLCEAPGVAPLPLDVAATQPEEVVVSVRDAGFEVIACEDASGGALRPDSRRLWLVARRTGS